MDDTSEPRPPWVAAILLIGVLIGLAGLRPGSMAGHTVGEGTLLTVLAAVAAIGYATWHVHGLIPAGLAILFFFLIESRDPSTAAAAERGTAALFLGTLALGLSAATRQGKVRRVGWWLAGLVALALAVFGWWRIDLPPAVDLVARQRLVHVTLAVAVVAVGMGLTRRAPWRDRLMLGLVALGPPAVGLIGRRLIQGEWPAALGPGEWLALRPELQGPLADGSWEQADWLQPSPWVMGPLLLLGVYRTLARGWQQRRTGQPPTAWLLAGGLTTAFLAGLYRDGGVGSLSQTAAVVVLSVFGVADSLLALVERIALSPPTPGPADVPRVK